MGRIIFTHCQKMQKDNCIIFVLVVHSIDTILKICRGSGGGGEKMKKSPGVRGHRTIMQVIEN